MNLKHDEEWLSPIWSTRTTDEYNCGPGDCKAYFEHMQRFHPASEWHEALGDVLWYRLPVDESPHVGSPTDDGWATEPMHILANGETNAEYYTHFQLIHTPEH